MGQKLKVGDQVFFQNMKVVIEKVDEKESKTRYYVKCGDQSLPMWIPESQVSFAKGGAEAASVCTDRVPSLLSVDGFYSDPDAIRNLALAQDFVTSETHYKGLRTRERFLFPYLRERFEKLLGVEIVDWLSQPANGIFQITGYNDPIVWHSDLQDYAAAIYLTPSAPLGSGTSFWRDKKHGCRRPPMHPYERSRFESEELAQTALRDVYNEYNYLHPDNWEHVESVAALYNRLVIFDAQLIHSASSYKSFAKQLVAEEMRLVQLFFFTTSRSLARRSF